ncbi:fimbrial protein [Serratia sp. T13T92]|uniref:fimbrial protein n=1 Tax=Serratia sp. T13T92 TaxID=3397496 RepID=UPI0039DF5D07
MMKIGFFLFILILSFNVNAFTCRDQNGNIYTDMSKDFNITIPLNQTIAPGDMIFFDLSPFFSCRNDSPEYRDDYLYLGAQGITTVLDNDIFNTSVTVNSRPYGKLPIRYPQSVQVYYFNDINFHPIPIKITYFVSDTPGKLVKIKAGDIMAKISMRFFSIPAGGLYNYNWNIIAGNSTMVTSGTCEINNGEDIKVDFGSISKNQLKTSDTSSTIVRTININYRCKNPISIPINISLSAVPSKFSNDLIRLSNDNIGVQMYYQGEKVKPGASISTLLNQGAGSSAFEFHLVKNANADVNTGSFSGSAVLVMSAQ